MKIIIFFLLVFYSLRCYSQAPAIEWAKCYGGTNLDYFLSIVQTPDSGYAAAGYTQSNDGDVTGLHGRADAWVIKTDAKGLIQWQKTYGGTSDEVANSIIQTSDGGFAVAGMTWSKDGDVSVNHGRGDFWVLKLSQTGAIEWQKTYGGSDDDEASSIIQIPDGGFMVTGYTYSNDGDVSGLHTSGLDDIWLIRLDSKGNLLWQKTYGGSRNDQAAMIIKTNDDHYVIAGINESQNGEATANHGKADYWLIKIDSVGKIVWQHSYGGSEDEFLFSVIQTSDGGYVLNGYSFSNDGDVSGGHGDADFWVVKLDDAGNLQWQKALGGSLREKGMSIRQMSDGGFLVIGCASSNDGDVTNNHGSEDGWMVKLCSSGNIVWEKCFGGSQGEEALSLVPTYDGGFAFAGDATSIDGDVNGLHGKAGMNDGWIVKLLPLSSSDSILSVYIKSSNYYERPSDTIAIPLYANNHATNSSFGSTIQLIYSLNTNLLTPFAFIPISGVTADPVLTTKTTATVTLHFDPSFIFKGETELGTLRCIPYVIADTLATDIILSGAAHSSGCLATLADSNVTHFTLTGCGTPMLSDFIKFGAAYNILSIIPNPAENSVQIQLKNNGALLHYELLDALGVMQKNGTTTDNQLQIDLSGLASGNYYFRLSGESGIPATKKLVIAK